MGESDEEKGVWYYSSNTADTVLYLLVKDRRLQRCPTTVDYCKRLPEHGESADKIYIFTHA